ncbi:thaumatin-like protein 1 isoform X1 [Arachis duranensis]|uniref:Thaumatin-like protein 1 isoform X1 n=1 Tax=Arachis duranensis TaxID=130453 RepID=A0A6P4DKI5_ARADU|nr:thaumatin-like protein 1 isoform X1 [Arachis duranensis]
MGSLLFSYYCFSTQIAFILFLFCLDKGALGAKFTIINKCDYTVWPGILANAGSSALDTTGFHLPSGGSRSFQAPPNWSGRFWGRTGCNFDPNTQQGTCTTGDCGSNKLECNGAGADPPVTLAEFTIGSGSQSQDYYDVSLVDGYNLPMMVDAGGGSGECGSTGCIADLNRQCPNELRVSNRVACKSACEAFQRAEYCCSGTYASPATCKPSVYSTMFKSACPKSYSYAYDDLTSTFTCTGADYTITFCPSTTSQKSARVSPPAPPETGTGEMPMIVNSSWFSDIFYGLSPKSYSCPTLLIATLTILIFLNLQSS